MLEVMFAAFMDLSGGYWANVGRALLLGFLLAVAYCGLWVVAALWNFAWAWIDDAPRKRYNCFSGFVAKALGYKWQGGTYDWYSKRFGYSDLLHFFPMLGTFLAPLVITTLLTFYSFFLTVAICIGAAFGTRFVRRMKKAFDKHVSDKHAHEKED